MSPVIISLVSAINCVLFYILFRNGRGFFLVLGQKQISRNQYGFHRLLAGYGSGSAMKTLIDHAGKKMSCFTFYHGTVARGWTVTLQYFEAP